MTKLVWLLIALVVIAIACDIIFFQRINVSTIISAISLVISVIALKRTTRHYEP